MSRPSLAELRAVCQPAGLRGAGEHWAGRLYMRRVSLHVTRLLIPTGVSPNQLTGIMAATGVTAGAVLLVPGIVGAVLAAVLVQLYLLLDCSDGEVARWTRRTSIVGVYLDRVGHYFAEAALLVGLGFRAAGVAPTGYAVLGCLAALGAVLIKAETDLVDVARARSGLPAASESAVQLRHAGIGSLRRVVAAVGLHRILGAVEASLLIVVAAVADAVRGDLTVTRALVVLLVAVAGTQVVLHLASILLSRRLR